MYTKRLIILLSCAFISINAVLAQSTSFRSTLQYEDTSAEDVPPYGTYQIHALSPSQIIDLPSDLASFIEEQRSASEEKMVKIQPGVWLRLLSTSQIASEEFIPLQSEVVIYDASLSNEGNAKFVGPCTPAISNGTSATATALTVGNDCLSGTTCGGGAPAPVGTCVPGTWQCAFYEFEATATDMTVFIDYVSSNGCVFYSTVFDSDAFGNPSSELSCQTGGLDKEHILTGLTTSDTYFVQVCYQPSGGGCNNGGNDGSANFCIVAMENDLPCDDCGTPCGDALGYLANPSVAQVVADCTTTRFAPSLASSSTQTYCNSFSTPISLTPVDVGFQVIVTSDCGTGPGPPSGNVSAFSWELFEASPCGATAIQTGDLSDLIFDNLPATSNYVYCYTFTVPSSCSHFQHCPYFVGAGVPLPVEMLEFSARAIDNSKILIEWATGVEIDNDYFTIERSRDNIAFESVGTVSGVGFSSIRHDYDFVDANPLPGLSYYRIVQTDYNGNSETFPTMAVELNDYALDIDLFLTEDGQYTLNVYAHENGNSDIAIFDILGNQVSQSRLATTPGLNQSKMNLSSLSAGIYNLRVINNGRYDSISFQKH